MPLIAVALLILTGAAAVDASLSDSGAQTEITGEEFNASTAGVVQLNQSDQAGARYAETVNVKNESDVEMVAGEDYTWDSTNGTIEVLSGGDLIGSDPASINYSYRVPSETQEAVGGVFASGFEVMGLLLLLLAVGALLGAVGRFA